MGENSRGFEGLTKIFEHLNFGAVCRECRGQCCHMPWLTQEELHLADRFPDAVHRVDGTAFFLERDRCTFLDEHGRCRIYDLRPLDCRLFPLDIIEEGGEFYWCVFTTCPNWQKMREMLEPLIPLLEDQINPALWRQFLRQIEVTKEEYLPYRRGQYVTIRRFAGRTD